jgi:hypothetical protein
LAAAAAAARPGAADAGTDWGPVQLDSGSDDECDLDSAGGSVGLGLGTGDSDPDVDSESGDVAALSLAC